ncbi:MAG: hypothetical protein Q8M93_13425 [Polaromonas sp.]|uniref:hypothetical protein n=1 Tax=Polaromonas sp. TaxID=1869339 RepID=UPI0027366B50|nr:hypothetical protein [Polaromonas sp.]MDP3247956.1 hypothetical protein [Polaromonas sp.]
MKRILDIFSFKNDASGTSLAPDPDAELHGNIIQIHAERDFEQFFHPDGGLKGRTLSKG